jgi:O-antigen/teichoic acid export membrane protein
MIAPSFIIVLFGEKFEPSIEVFRLLIISIIPFVLTVAPVNAIVYGMKKPKYIGYFSLFQLAAVIVLNIVFIPDYGVLGPTYTLLVVHTLFALFTWAIVLRYYWLHD